MRKIMLVLSGILTVCACSSIDCPVQNTVATVYQICDESEKPDTLHDTLTITTRRANGIDTTLLNRAIGITSFTLPISYSCAVDTLFFQFKGTAERQTDATDTVLVYKQDIPHFESVDCSAAFFHEIDSVCCKTTHVIRKIEVIKSSVTYDQSSEHFHLYLQDND